MCTLADSGLIINAAEERCHMLNDLNRQLSEMRKQVRAKRKLEAMLGQVEQTLLALRHDRAELRKRLSAEKADVDKLESISLTSLFHSVLGSKQERLDKEKREYVAAQLKFDASNKAVEETEEHADQLRAALDELQGVDRDYERLLKEKQDWLASSNDPRAGRLSELLERQSDLESVRKELREAVGAGERASKALRRVQADLASAGNWGTVDLLGGGMLTTMAKHSKIDAAKQHAHEAQRYLRKFQQELADADSRLNVSLEMGGFSKFADYFFDGLLADWVMQSKIREASSACSSTISRVASSVATCRQRLRETEEELAAVEQQRREMIENAE
jgi:hypothetical protein